MYAGSPQKWGLFAAFYRAEGGRWADALGEGFIGGLGLQPSSRAAPRPISAATRSSCPRGVLLELVVRRWAMVTCGVLVGSPGLSERSAFYGGFIGTWEMGAGCEGSSAE